jgi:hypothetical protein
MAEIAEQIKYDIFVTTHEATDRATIYGIEVQPPLSELAASGLCKAMTYGHPNSVSPLAECAEVTRSDEFGTALFAVLNQEHARQSEEVFGDSVAAMINPAKQHIVEVHPV